jgi:protein-disulfide isomerase
MKDCGNSMKTALCWGHCDKEKEYERNLMKLFILSLIVAVMGVSGVMAQTLQQTPVGEPEMPAPLAAAVEDGVQAIYLGEFEGLFGWALIRQGRPEYYYATADNSAIIMGILFDGEGEMITSGQLAQLKANKGDDMFALTGGIDEVNTTPTSNAPAQPRTRTPAQEIDGFATSITSEPLTPAQEMFVDIQAANWMTWGPNGTYEIFAFLDPDCPHCQRFAADAKPLIDNGTLKVRALPMGLNPLAEQKAALMLAGSNPLDRFLRYADGDTDALNPPASINVSAVQKNRELMNEWGFDVTPVIVYRTGKGEIRIIRGRPQSFDTIFQDIANN